MHEQRYVGINPFFILTLPLHGIAVDGAAAPVLCRSPDEAWRVIRTRWRVDGKVGGPIEGGGRPSGTSLRPPASRFTTVTSGHRIFPGTPLSRTAGAISFIGKNFNPPGSASWRGDQRMSGTGNSSPRRIPCSARCRWRSARTARCTSPRPRSDRAPVDTSGGSRKTTSTAAMTGDGLSYRARYFCAAGYFNVGQATVARVGCDFGSPKRLVSQHSGSPCCLSYRTSGRCTIAPLGQTRGKTDLGRMHALHALAGLNALVFEDDGSDGGWLPSGSGSRRALG